MSSIREYTVTYIAKEFLQRNGWKIIAYNPPGSQGTFTITDPQKDGGYRGQTGSLSPDIIALKASRLRNIFLVVESKPDYELKDVEKMKKMLKQPERLELFYRIIKGHIMANEIPYDESLPKEVYFAKAHSGKINSTDEVGTILITQDSKEWNLKCFSANEDIFKKFNVEFHKSFSED